jgi:DNA-binding beta-propeller fold protein YncE
MRRLAALLTLALPLLAGCSTRARLNPFDPANPATGGHPANFEAVAGNQSVRLRWQVSLAPRLLGYQVFRRAPGDTAFRPLTVVLPPTTSSHADFGLLNGAEHRYQLYFVIEDGLAGPPAEDVATPGPLRPWVADPRSGRLVRLSADGRRLAESFAPAGGARPVAVDVDPTHARVWVVGPGGDVLVYEPGSGQSTVIGQGLGTLACVVADRRDSSAWVGDVSNGRVVHLFPSGKSADPPLLGGLAYPGSLALDRSNGSLWVVEQDGERVRRYTAAGALAATAAVSQPSRVAVDPVTHEAWVSSSSLGRIVRLAPDGTALDTILACTAPLGIAVDAARRRIWVADAGGDRVVALAPDGTVQFMITRQAEAREIAIDEATGEAWVTLAAAGAVARLSPAGVEVLRVGGLGRPWGIALDDVTTRATPFARNEASGALR